MQTKGLSERHGLRVMRMSASALRYEPRPDRNPVLRQRIVALAQRHRRYGVGMIYLKLRQAGELVNYKRVERLYRLEKLHIRRRRRKKIPVADRQPLIRPDQANQIWSMDFVFDRIATGRTLKCLTNKGFVEARINRGGIGIIHGLLLTQSRVANEQGQTPDYIGYQKPGWPMELRPPVYGWFVSGLQSVASLCAKGSRGILATTRPNAWSSRVSRCC